MRKLGFLLLAACGGGLSTQDGGTGDASPSGESYRVLPSSNATCDGDPNLTGAAVIAQVKSRYDAMFSSALFDGPPTPLTLTFTYDKGEIRCHPAIKSCAQCGAPDMPAWIEVGFDTAIDTKNGYFAERLTTWVSRHPYTSELSFSGAVPATTMKGTFKPVLTDGAWDKHEVSFSGSLVGTGSSGTASEQASRNLGNVGMGQTTNLGTWN